MVAKFRVRPVKSGRLRKAQATPLFKALQEKHEEKIVVFFLSFLLLLAAHDDASFSHQRSNLCFSVETES